MLPPMIMPQVPSKISISGDTEIQISAYIGDDIMVTRAYIEFEGKIIPMKTSEEITPGTNKLYYYTATVYIKKFDGEKTIRIIAKDLVGRESIYELKVHCRIPTLEKTEVRVGIAVGVIIAAVVIFFILRKILMTRKTEE